MFTNNINARKMMAEVFAYQSPSPAPAPRAPKGRARTAPAQVEETFESDSESSFAGSVRSSSSLVSVDDVPPPPVGSAAPRVGPTKSQKPKKSAKKEMAKTKPLPPPAAPVLKVEAAAPAPEKKVSKKLTKKESPVADLPPVKVDLPEKIVLAQKLEQPEKKKRVPSAYNTFVSKHMKGGLSMVAIAGLWKAEKAGKAAKD